MAQCPMTSGDATYREYVGLYQVDSATFIFVLYLQKLVCKMKKKYTKGLYDGRIVDVIIAITNIEFISTPTTGKCTLLHLLFEQKTL